MWRLMVRPSMLRIMIKSKTFFILSILSVVIGITNVFTIFCFFWYIDVYIEAVQRVRAGG